MVIINKVQVTEILILNGVHYIFLVKIKNKKKRFYKVVL